MAKQIKYIPCSSGELVTQILDVCLLDGCEIVFEIPMMDRITDGMMLSRIREGVNVAAEYLEKRWYPFDVLYIYEIVKNQKYVGKIFARSIATERDEQRLQDEVYSLMNEPFDISA